MIISKLQIKKIAKDLYAWSEKKDPKTVLATTKHIAQIFYKKGARRQLKELVTVLEKLDEQKREVSRVNIASAFKLSAAVEQKLISGLGIKDAIITQTIKPELLGGAEIRFNDKLLNLSLSNQLNNLLKIDYNSGEAAP